MSTKVYKKEIKVGDKYVLSESGARNFYDSSAGDEIKVTSNPHGGGVCFTILKSGTNQITYQPSKDFRRILSASKERIQENITNYKKQIASINDKIKEEQSKLDWMEEAGVDNFNQDEYTIWKALETLEKKGISKMEKVKKLNEIINNKKK